MSGVLQGTWRGLCRRGLHADVPDNAYLRSTGRRECLPCKRDRDRRNKRAHRGSTCDVRHGIRRSGRLTEGDLNRLRSLVACLGCGAAPEVIQGSVVTRHRRGCRVADIREGAA